MTQWILKEPVHGSDSQDAMFNIALSLEGFGTGAPLLIPAPDPRLAEAKDLVWSEIADAAKERDYQLSIADHDAPGNEARSRKREWESVLRAYAAVRALLALRPAPASHEEVR
jgi:hypothetical protein